MQRYVDYLLEDIDNAKENVPVFYQNDDHEMLLLPPQEERATAPEKPLKDWLQLEPVIFPPVKKLNQQQIRAIMLALEDLLLAFNYIIYFPSGTSIEKKYEVLMGHFNQVTPLLTYNFWQIDFCDNTEKGCPFGLESCQCHIAQKMMENLLQDDGTEALDLEGFLEQIEEINFNTDETIYLGDNYLNDQEIELLLDEEFFFTDDDFDFDMDDLGFFDDGED